MPRNYVALHFTKPNPIAERVLLPLRYTSNNKNRSAGRVTIGDLPADIAQWLYAAGGFAVMLIVLFTVTRRNREP